MIPPMGYRGQAPVPRHGVLTSTNPFSPLFRQLFGLSEPLVDTVRPYDSVALMYAPFIESLPGIPSKIGYRLSNITAPPRCLWIFSCVRTFTIVGVVHLMRLL